MADIKTFNFEKLEFEQIKNFALGTDWPVVYIIEDGHEVYIGETTSAYNRSKQHFENADRAKLERMHLITDVEYNKSATLDIESLLIQYFSAEGTLRLQNGNRGLVNHNYFDKARYLAKFEALWAKLQEMSLVKRNLNDVKNSEMFKYSPYKALSNDQLAVAEELQMIVQKNETGTHIINGGPGTGKTVLATYLVKSLKENKDTAHLKIGLVVPMTSLRHSIKNVFSRVEGLSEQMVLGPSEVINDKYDLLIVDEAHRLRQRKNLTNYKSHDIVNEKLGLGHEGTELDWVLMSSRHQILFFDENQSIRPTDVHARHFHNLDATRHHLVSQLRVGGGEKYMQFVEDLFEYEKSLDTNFSSYDFKIYDDLSQMIADIKAKNTAIGLCRIVAGFAWRWVSKANPTLHDIEIDGLKLKWNSRKDDWVNSPNAINEVGCIHTLQGYDLNYIGIIVGPELTYNKDTKRLAINPDKYEDTNGWKGITDPAELERYIINIYKTLMTRGIKGCYLYFVDKETESFFKSRIESH